MQCRFVLQAEAPCGATEHLTTYNIRPVSGLTLQECHKICCMSVCTCVCYVTKCFKLAVPAFASRPWSCRCPPGLPVHAGYSNGPCDAPVTRKTCETHAETRVHILADQRICKLVHRVCAAYCTNVEMPLKRLRKAAELQQPRIQQSQASEPTADLEHLPKKRKASSCQPKPGKKHLSPSCRSSGKQAVEQDTINDVLLGGVADQSQLPSASVGKQKAQDRVASPFQGLGSFAGFGNVPPADLEPKSSKQNLQQQSDEEEAFEERTDDRANDPACIQCDDGGASFFIMQNFIKTLYMCEQQCPAEDGMSNWVSNHASCCTNDPCLIHGTFTLSSTCCTKQHA